jgi:MoaA/NifB/PqqE/SkfB family radical SAM enzyme
VRVVVETLIDELRRCESVRDFGEARAPLGLHSQGPRFLHLELDLVNRCNIRCIMCFHSLPEVRSARIAYLSPDDFARVAARVLPHVYHLSLSLGNEPLMSPHFTDVLRIAAEYAVPNVNFFTNALWLDDRKADAIIQYGVTQLCCSIDGATAATYNAIRRDGDFDRVTRNVAAFIRRCNAAGSRTPVVRFDFVMMQRNVHEMVDLVELAARLGAELNFCHVVSYEGLDVERESLKYTRALSNYWLERALARAADLGLQVQFAPAPFALEDEETRTGPAAAPAGAEPYLPTPYCPFPFFHISMGPGGHVLPCPYAHGEAPYGQVTETTPNRPHLARREVCRVADAHPSPRSAEHVPALRLSLEQVSRCRFAVRDAAAGRRLMETRPIGRTGIELSVVGLGTAQLQMVPERQAIETLVRGFELGVNWVHTAPDYGGIDPWIRKAIEIAGREVMVLSIGRIKA